MKNAFKNVISKFLLIKPVERLLVLWSFIYFFCLLSGYFILRPLRDEMGILNGANNMQWLFTGTFLTMLLIVPLFGYVTKHYRLKNVLVISYTFFISHMVLFYIFLNFFGKSNTLAILFFIWLSVFNLFVVSLFWSFMTDVFSSEASKRVFGFIASGGSLGALFGPIVSGVIVVNSGIENLLLGAILFLLIALYTISKIIALRQPLIMDKSESTFNTNNLLNKTFWQDIFKALQSKYLLGIILFIVLYTSVSTILYFQQAHSLESTIKDSHERILYFSKVDFFTNLMAITIQMFLTNRIIKKYGLAITLASIPIFIAIGLLMLSIKLSVIGIAVLMVVHRAGNFSLLKPSREILFTVCSKAEKYRVKNFIDTVVYRGGDAIMGWIFTLFFSFGLGLTIIALLAIPLVLLWSFTGYKLGNRHKLKTLIHEN